MPTPFFDLDLDFPRGEIPSNALQLIQVWEVNEENKKGWILDLEIPRKKKNFGFLAFYPERINPEDLTNLHPGSLKGFGALVVQVTKKKALTLKLNYMWTGKSFIPAPINNLSSVK